MAGLLDLWVLLELKADEEYDELVDLSLKMAA